MDSFETGHTEPACRPDEGLHVVQVHPTLQCNLRCRHCYSSSSPQGRSQLHLQQLQIFLQYANLYGFNTLSVSGGEPFIYRDLEALLAGSRAAGYKNMTATNAMLFGGARARRCLELLDLVAISIDGDEETHDAIRAFPGAFRKMCSGVKTAREAGSLFGFIHTVTDRSWESLLWLAGFAADEGAQLLQLHPLELTGRAVTEFNQLLPTQEALHKAYIISSYLREKYAGRMHVHADFFHRDAVLQNPFSVSYYGDGFQLTLENFAATLRSIIIDPAGNVYPLSYGFGNAFRIGHIGETARGIDIFNRFINEKGDGFYALFKQVFHRIEAAADTDMVTWTEMIVKESRRERMLSCA